MATVEDQEFIAERRKQEVLRLRIVGYHPREIGGMLDVTFGGPITRRQVDRILKDAADEHREQSAELYDRLIAEQTERLEWLYSVCARVIRGDGTVNGTVPDEKLIRTAVLVLERQAKLLGLDAGKGVAASPTERNDEWLRTAPIEQVIKHGESLGMKMPPAKFA